MRIAIAILAVTFLAVTPAAAKSVRVPTADQRAKYNIEEPHASSFTTFELVRIPGHKRNRPTAERGSSRMADLRSRSYLSTLRSHCCIHSVFRMGTVHAIWSPQMRSGSAKASTGPQHPFGQIDTINAAFGSDSLLEIGKIPAGPTSYNVMPHHRSVLRQVWKQLRPGGRLVIMDARLPPGLLGKLIRPFAIWLMKQTLLGNPLIRPWQYHAALVDDFHMEDFRFSSYYICCGTKPERDLTNPGLLPAAGHARTDHRSLSQHSRRRLDKLPKRY